MIATCYPQRTPRNIKAFGQIRNRERSILVRLGTDVCLIAPRRKNWQTMPSGGTDWCALDGYSCMSRSSAAQGGPHCTIRRVQMPRPAWGTYPRSPRHRNSRRKHEFQRGEPNMCPACIASTAVMVAGAGSTGGLLAVCIAKFRKVFTMNRLHLFQKTQEKQHGNE